MNFSYFLIPTDEKTILTAEPWHQDSGQCHFSHAKEFRVHFSELAAQPSLDFERNLNIESHRNLSSSDDNDYNNNSNYNDEWHIKHLLSCLVLVSAYGQ